MNNQKKVLIIGGGIGGPALATFLARQGNSVTLVEKSFEWKNIGFGVTIWGIGRKVLRKLGIEEQLADAGQPVKFVRLISGDESLIIELDFKKFAAFGGEAIIVPRSKLHEQLLEAIPPSVTILQGTTVTDIKQEDKQVHVVFNDGASHTFDLVVGAEGVHSQTREMVSPNNVSFYNWSVVAFWMPENVPNPKDVVCISETDRTLCFYPTKKRTFIAIANYNIASQKRPAEKFITPFVPYLLKHGWGKADIEKVIAESSSYYMDDMRYIQMGAWSKESVVLVGDARHAFVPIIGMGANLALEDAQVLAEELEKVGTKDIDMALRAYAKRRTPRVNKVRALSRLLEPWFNTRSSVFVSIRKFIAPYLPKFLIEHKFYRVLKQEI